MLYLSCSKYKTSYYLILNINKLHKQNNQPCPWHLKGNMFKAFDTTDQIHSLSCFPKALYHSSVQFSSVAQSYPTLWDVMNPSTPGLPVHHQLPEFTQTHVHRVGDAIPPSHPLSSPSPPALNASSIRVFCLLIN